MHPIKLQDVSGLVEFLYVRLSDGAVVPTVFHSYT